MHIDNPASREIVALTGFMGTGKTTIGRALAGLLNWAFFDLDSEIELEQKLAVRQIFQMHGELGFREVEVATLRALLERVTGPTVIALGGGTFVQSANENLLRTCGVRVVFLETAVEQLLMRCQVSDQQARENPRPLAATPEAFRALYAQRLPYYRSADLTLNATGKTVEDVAQEIVKSLRLSPSLR